MKVKRITEVGMAVKNLEETTRLFVELLGAEAGEVIEVEMFQMRYRMCRLGGVDFELMEPASETGIIADFIKKRGQGLHHIGFAVEEIENGMKVLQDRGVTFIADQPMELSGETVDFVGHRHSGSAKFTFSLPGSFSGVLMEFIEYPGDFSLNGP